MRTESKSSRRQLVIIPAQSVYDVAFMDTNPNSVYVRNNGDANIYVGFHFTPSSNNCDLTIKPGMVKTYGEQNPFGRMLVYNESANPAQIIVTSWEADFFDPSLLQGDIDLTADLSNTIAYDGVIKGFESSLPAGENTIGGVNVVNPTWTAAKITELLAAVNVWGASDVSEVLTLLAAIRDKESGGSSGGSVTIEELNNTTMEEGEIEAGSSKSVVGKCRLCFFSNDSDVVLSISALASNGNYTTTMAVKPGEVLTDINFAYGFMVLGNASSIAAYRMSYSK